MGNLREEVGNVLGEITWEIKTADELTPAAQRIDFAPE
jgi:hypothetical protein